MRDLFGKENFDIDYSGANLHAGDLSGCIFTRCRFNGANLSHATLNRSNFIDCELQGANLEGLHADHASFNRVSFETANLSHATLNRSNFIDCELQGANLEGLHADHASFNRVSFETANLSHATLNSCDLIDCELRRSNLEGLRADHASFTHVSFEFAKIHQANFFGSRIEGGSLEHADLYWCELKDVEIQGTSMRWLHATCTHLDAIRVLDAKLDGAEFLMVWLDGATIERADCSHASFNRVEMKNTVWRFVDLSNASFVEVDCSDSVWENCRVFGLRICRVFGIPRTQEGINCAGIGEPDLIVNDIKLAPFLNELDRDDAMGRLVETLSSRLVLLLGRFAVDQKAVLDRLHRAFRRAGFIPVIVDSEFSGLLSAGDAVRALALCARFVVADVTDAHDVRAEVPQILSLRPVPVKPIVKAGQSEPVQFRWQRRHYPQLLLPVYEYSDLEALIENLGPAVIQPCEEALDRLRQII